MDDTHIITVATAADTFDLTTVTGVKADLKIATNDFDSVLLEMIHRWSAVAADYCNRVFARQTYVEAIRLASWRDNLILRHRPVESIASLIEDDVTLTAADYEIAAETGIIYRMSGGVGVRWRAAKVVVTYDAGYELLGGLPRGIEEAVRILVRMAWFASGRDPLVKRSEVVGISVRDYWVGGIPGHDGGLPPEVTDKLDLHRDVTA